MRQTTYALPGGGLPASITVSPPAWVWYAGPDGSLGAIDPLSAPGNAQTVARETYHTALEPICTALQATTAQATVESATVDWSPLTLASTGEEGWTRYDLPRTATLRGVAASTHTTWVIDSLTQRLIEIPVTLPERHRLNVPLVLKGRAS
jgi:hypothetical protein